MSAKSLLCIGRATVDLVSMVESFPPADGKITALQSGVFSGGPALNAAIAASALSSNATLISSAGQNGLWSDFVRAELAQYGVSLTDIAATDTYAPPVSQIISTRSTGARSIINQPWAQPDGKPSLDPHILREHVNSAGAILFDQFEADFVSNNLEVLNSASAPKILDAGSFKPQTKMFLDLCDIPIVSERFCNDVGIAPDNMASFFAEHDIATWAVTMGPNGILYTENAQRGHIPARKIDAIDTLGAGDIFHGAFCAGLLKNLGFADSLKMADKVAATSCRFFGTREWIDHIDD